MTDSEKNLTVKAKQYLKQSFGEDTISMTITKNAVHNGTGIFSVDCTVSVGGHQSDWSKDFHFKNSVIEHMDYRLR
ncbi:MAG: hypothetical protein PHQ04_11605 [Opitutaceae bacterium]|nr:hypothetical protein [Opitutaceae bacterium]